MTERITELRTALQDLATEAKRLLGIAQKLVEGIGTTPPPQFVQVLEGHRPLSMGQRELDRITERSKKVGELADTGASETSEKELERLQQWSEDNSHMLRWHLGVLFSIWTGK